MIQAHTKHMKFLNILIVIITINFTTRTVAQEREALPAQDAMGTPASDVEKNTEKFIQLIAAMWTREIPLTDDTNFDSFIEAEDYKTVDAKTLKLEEVYPDFNKEGYNYKAIRSYKIELSEEFYAVVVTLLKGEHEMESTLINYDLKGNIIDYHVIAYDEIAEGQSRIESKITKNMIESNHIFYGNQVQIERILSAILDDGIIDGIDLVELHKEYDNYPLIYETLEQLHLNQLDINMELFVNKVMPNNESEIIMVIPEIIEESIDGLKMDCHIVVVNVQTQKVIHHYVDKGYRSNAVQLTEISIDTARYQVSENERAFGLRVFYYSRSQPNPYSNKTLSLYVKSGDSLRNILNSYDAMEYSGEWDTRCAGEFTDMKNIFIISKEKTNGYFDIIVKSEITDTESFLDKKDECNSTEKLSTKKTVLKYDGKAYH
ncbi:hypothetical protein [uncultured Winogradskyella sp.]|uniref:hypothetical protein n=1 Tax=uncultured Winogradskyella sp. TaxID=395353 RepID=UPI00262761DB|nr:hypothetical protein [uncultured Winogradskyella sp.]